jgi:hypothetical protein
LKRLIVFKPGLGPNLMLAACSLIVGIIVGSKIDMSAAAASLHLPAGSAKPAPSCTIGFRVSTGDHPQGPKDVYKCSSSPPVCSRGYSVQNDQTEGPNVMTRNPRFAVVPPFNGEFVYDCNFP